MESKKAECERIQSPNLLIRLCFFIVRSIVKTVETIDAWFPILGKCMIAFSSVMRGIAELENWLFNFLFGWMTPYFNAIGAFFASKYAAINRRFPFVGKVMNVCGTIGYILFGLMMVYLVVGMIAVTPFMCIQVMNLAMEANLTYHGDYEKVVGCYGANRITNETLIKMIDGDFWAGAGEITGLGVTKCLMTTAFTNVGEELQTEL